MLGRMSNADIYALIQAQMNPPAPPPPPPPPPSPLLGGGYSNEQIYQAIQQQMAPPPPPPPPPAMPNLLTQAPPPGVDPIAQASQQLTQARTASPTEGFQGVGPADQSGYGMNLISGKSTNPYTRAEASYKWFDPANLKNLAAGLEPGGSPVTFLSPDGKVMTLAHGNNGSLRVYEVPDDIRGNMLSGTNTSALNGINYDEFSQDGKFLGGNTFEGLETGWGPLKALLVAFGGPLAGSAMAGAAGAAGAGAGAGAGAAGAGAGMTAELAAGAGLGFGEAIGAGIGTLEGLGAAGLGAGTSSMGAAGGLGGSSGTGLSLGGGSLGLNASAGPGLTLGQGSTIGLSAASPGAGAIGAGIGAGELLAGTGSLLGPIASGSGSGAAGAGAGGSAAAGGGGAGGVGGAGAAGSAGAGGAGGGGGGAGAGAGVPPPPNPGSLETWMNPETWGNALSSSLSSSLTSSLNPLLGGITSLLGGIAGAQGESAEQSSVRSMDPRMDSLFYGDLAPKIQGLLGSQMPQAQAAGDQMRSVGQGLLNAPIAGNGVGQVQMGADPTMPNSQVRSLGLDSVNRPQGPAMPTTQVAGNGVGQVQYNAPGASPNPYLQSVMDDITRRSEQALGRSLSGIRGDAVSVGGLGGSRQGIAESESIKGVLDSLQGNLSNLGFSAYESDNNRALQKYGLDQNFYQGQRGQDLQLRGQDLDVYNAGQNRALSEYQGNQSYLSGLRGQDIGMRGQDLSLFDSQQARNLQKYGLDQGFYNSQRGQDLTQAGIGQSLLQSGLQAPWTPVQGASQAYSPFTGFGTTTNTTQQGGGWQGALGGALGAAQFGSNMGWW